jgi:hypothetical protein
MIGFRRRREAHMIGTRSIRRGAVRAAWALLIAAGALGVDTGAALVISSPSGIDSRIRLEYEIGRTRSGAPEIQGFVYNDYARPANNVRLLVESLDEQGQVIGRSYGYVFGIVPTFNRTPFNVRVGTPGASYRITVTSFEWRDGGPA